MDENKILEGVFAISKPPSLSSAQVLRDLQNRFSTSKTFNPLLKDTQQKKKENERHQNKRRRRDDSDQFFKMGHGGTLDPLATGVLIVGIGRGTKTLGSFLGCTKQYDTVVLFGKSTDSYDICGKIVGERSYDRITKEKVEQNLEPFKGNIKQVPPVYSALKINGIKAYEYARSGKELPRELESRDMVVDECTLVDYYEGGQHDFRWPVEEAPADEKAAVEKLIRRGEPLKDAKDEISGKDQPAQDLPVKGHDLEKVETAIPFTEAQINEVPTERTTPPASKEQSPPRGRGPLDTASKAALHTHDIPTLTTNPSPSPAARIRLQVSSGFYVRSFAHDLGLSLSTYGIMAELIRTRQQNFTLLSPPPTGQITALTYADLEAGEEIWGPKIKDILERWQEENPVTAETDRIDDRDRPERSQNYRGPGGGKSRQSWQKRGHQNSQVGGRFSADRQDERPERRRRNSSSPE